MIGLMIGLVLIFIGYILLITTGTKVDTDSNRISYNKYVLALIVIIFISSFLLGVGGMGNYTKEQTFEKALKGQNPYEMHIQYEITDSTVHPVDTVYRLKSQK